MPPEDGPPVHLCVAAVRPERLSVSPKQLGASSLVLVVSERTQRPRAGAGLVPRLRRVVEEAAEQSESARWPRIDGPVAYASALSIERAQRFLPILAASRCRRSSRSRTRRCSSVRREDGATSSTPRRSRLAGSRPRSHRESFGPRPPRSRDSPSSGRRSRVRRGRAARIDTPPGLGQYSRSHPGRAKRTGGGPHVVRGRQESLDRLPATSPTRYSTRSPTSSTTARRCSKAPGCTRTAMGRPSSGSTSTSSASTTPARSTGWTCRCRWPSSRRPSSRPSGPTGTTSVTSGPSSIAASAPSASTRSTARSTMIAVSGGGANISAKRRSSRASTSACLPGTAWLPTPSRPWRRPPATTSIPP